MFDNAIYYIQNFIVLFSAITIHEFSHGIVSYKLGDPTAKNMGRLTLNPLAHLDPLGALMMIFCRFGWAKPVPVNPYYFKEPKKDMALVSFAGPLSNVFCAFLFATIYPFVIIGLQLAGVILFPVISFIEGTLAAGIYVNIYFAVFNLIPFPPLDGSKILFSILPTRVYNVFITYERYGTIILLVLSFSGVLGKILGIAAEPVIEIMLNWMELIFNFIISLL